MFNYSLHPKCRQGKAIFGSEAVSSEYWIRSFHTLQTNSRYIFGLRNSRHSGDGKCRWRSCRGLRLLFILFDHINVQKREMLPDPDASTLNDFQLLYPTGMIRTYFAIIVISFTSLKCSLAREYTQGERRIFVYNSEFHAFIATIRYTFYLFSKNVKKLS